MTPKRQRPDHPRQGGRGRETSPRGEYLEAYSGERMPSDASAKICGERVTAPTNRETNAQPLNGRSAARSAARPHNEATGFSPTDPPTLGARFATR